MRFVLPPPPPLLLQFPPPPVLLQTLDESTGDEMSWSRESVLGTSAAAAAMTDAAAAAVVKGIKGKWGNKSVSVRECKE